MFCPDLFLLKDTVLPNGWIFNFGASHSMEYSFTSYAVAQMAKQLGHKEDYAKLIKQAGYWRNTFDSESHFIRPKLPNGNFIADFDTLIAWRGISGRECISIYLVCPS